MPHTLDQHVDDRKQEEIDFHNRREIDRQSLGPAEFERKYSNKKWYSVVRRSREFSNRWIAENCDGGTVLDYCCGLGGTSLELAQAGAFVHGIDISDESVETARELLTAEGYGDCCDMRVMDAENLEFPDDTFDAIICSGVLHHLDLERAYSELSRVLKPSGKILCLEALGHNPAIRWYRKVTPHLRTSWEVDHILKKKDLALARRFFGKLDENYFHLFSLGAVPFRRTPLFAPLLSALEAVDSLVLKAPGVRLMAWQVLFELSEPIKQRRALRRAA